jgi:hypothetical protein
VSDTPTSNPDEGSPSAQPVISASGHKQVERAFAALGVPVIATASFWVEGTWPWIFIGSLVGAGVLQGALGALLGLGAGYGVAWLVTRRRAGGAGLSTVLAVTATDLYAIKASLWTGRPVADKRIGSWPLDTVDLQVRSKRIATAVSIGLAGGRRMQLETTGRKRSALLVAELRGSSQ